MAVSISPAIPGRRMTRDSASWMKRTRFVGVYQVNAQVPAGTSPADVVPVVIIQGGVESNAATIAVQ